MSKQKRDNDYRGFQLERTEKFAFVEGTESLVCLVHECSNCVDETVACKAVF